MIDFVTYLLLPLGLAAIMYGLGLSLNLVDFQRLMRFPRALFVGLLGQLIGLPLIAFLLARAADLPPELAVSLIVIAACPGGVTSNALVFIGRADVALSITMTAVSSLITIFSTPFFVMLALHTFFVDTDMPPLDLVGATGKLFVFTALPIAAGLATRLFLPSLAMRLIVWVRPASFGILLTIITFSVLMNWTLVTENLVSMAPIAFFMNVAAMALGLWLAKRFVLPARQQATIAVELGVQNATMATFVAVAVLHRIELAAAPTIYGIIMVINALVILRFARRYWTS
ncbi:MAG: hypothetical protein WEB93_06580 [Sphingomonadales bacterium]